jgi:geranyl-CoA carboxylase beta subunit
MMRFESKIDVTSEEFEINRLGNLALLERLRLLEDRPRQLSEKRKPRFEKRGQLTPSERLAHILDPGMPVLFLHTLAGYLVDTEDEEISVPGSSMILALGFVAGVRAMIWIDDSGIKAGAMGAQTLPAALSIQDIALRQKLPLIHLVESAGANLMEYQVEVWAKAGGIFHNLARLSAASIPTIAVLHGASTAGGAYMPGLSDYVIGVKKNGMAALAGAALVNAATGEVADDRQLGGSEMHASVSGLVEYLVEDDAQAIEQARSVVTRLNWNTRTMPVAQPEFMPPKYSPDEIAGVVPTDYRSPYDASEVVARIVDGSNFDSFKPGFGLSTLCLQASIHGRSVGIICNNGPIDPAGASKATQFIQLCDQADTPVIFLNNTTGFMVGTEYEQSGMIKHGSKMVQAVSNARVPKLTVYIGASFGAGNYAMGGYAYRPDFIFTWPNATTGVMGGSQAADTMSMVAKAGAARTGNEIDEDALKAQNAKTKAHFDRQANAFYTSGRCLYHGMIDPRDTRNVLAFCLATCAEARQRTLKPNTFGVARI